MNTYTLTITATFDAENVEEAINDFAEWLSQPHNVEDGTVVQIEEDDGSTHLADCVCHLHDTEPVECPTCGALYGEMDHAAEPCEDDQPTGYITPVFAPRAENERPTS